MTHYISIAQTLYLDPSVYDSLEYGYFTHLIFFPLVVRIVFPFNLIISSYIVGMVSWAGSGALFLKICEMEEIDFRYRFILLFLFLGGFNVFSLFSSTNGSISLIMLLTMLGYYFYRKEKHPIAGLFIGLTAITHIACVIFPVAYVLIMLGKIKSIMFKRN